MAAPLIESGDITATSQTTSVASWEVNRPAQADGDLIICCLACPDLPTHGTLPDGPNAETATVLINSPRTAPGISVWYWVANGAAEAGTMTVTPSASGRFQARVALVPAGEFDAADPVGAFASANGNSTSVDSPAFSAAADDGGGRLVVWAIAQADPLSNDPAGWTNAATIALGAVGGRLATRDAETTNSESIASVSWTIAGDTWETLGFIVRGPSAGGSSLTISGVTPAKAKHGVTCSVSGDQLQSARFSWNLYSAGGTTILASLSQSAVSQATTSANILVFLRDFPYTDLTGTNWRIALHASAASASVSGEASAELSVAHTAEDIWIWSEYNGETIPSSASAHSFWEGHAPTSGDQLRVLRALSGSAQFSELSADGTFVITSALSGAVVTAYPQEFSGSAFAWQASASIEITVDGQETQLAFSSAAAQSASYTQIFVHTVHTKDAEVMVLAQSTEPTTAEFEAVTQGTYTSGVATVSGLATGSAYTIWVRISASGSAEVTSFPAFASIDPLSLSAAFGSAGLTEIYAHASASRTADFMFLARTTADGEPSSAQFDAAIYGSGESIVATVSGLATNSAYQIWVKVSSEHSSEVTFFNVLTSSPAPDPLAFTSGPAALSADYTQIFVHAVANRSATLAVIAQTTASGQPTTADFDAVEFSALSAVATLSGLATGSAYRIWARIDDGTSATYESFNAVTSAKVIVTASADAAIQSRTFTQVVFLLTPETSAAVQYVQTTASAPQPSTATFELGSAGTLSATPVTATVSGLTTGETYRLWYRAVNADDEFISFLQFQTSAPTIDADNPNSNRQISISRSFKIGL